MKILAGMCIGIWIIYALNVIHSTYRYPSREYIEDLLQEDYSIIYFISYKHLRPIYYNRTYLEKDIKKLSMVLDELKIDFECAYVHFDLSIEYLLLYYLSKEREQEYLLDSLLHIVEARKLMNDNPLFQLVHAFICEKMGLYDIALSYYYDYREQGYDIYFLDQRIAKLSVQNYPFITQR